MIDLDKIKEQWSSLKVENAELQKKNQELTRRLVNERVTNNQQRLAKSYNVGYMGFAFPALALLLYNVIECSVILCVIYSIYGIILGCFDIWFKKFIKRIDYITVPTVVALEHATKIVVYQNIATIVSIASALAVLIPMFYEFAEIDGEVFTGGIIGGVIGAIIGGIKCWKNHRIARKMLAELRSIDAWSLCRCNDIMTMK